MAPMYRSALTPTPTLPLPLPLTLTGDGADVQVRLDCVQRLGLLG